MKLCEVKQTQHSVSNRKYMEKKTNPGEDEALTCALTFKFKHAKKTPDHVFSLFAEMPSTPGSNYYTYLITSSSGWEVASDDL